MKLINLETLESKDGKTLDEQLTKLTNHGYSCDWAFCLYFDESYKMENDNESGYTDINYGYYNESIDCFALMSFDDSLKACEWHTAGTGRNFLLIVRDKSGEIKKENNKMIQMEYAVKMFDGFYSLENEKSIIKGMDNIKKECHGLQDLIERTENKKTIGAINKTINYLNDEYNNLHRQLMISDRAEEMEWLRGNKA